MPQWLGTGIVLLAVALLVGTGVYFRTRAAKRGGGCSCGCAGCAFDCPSRREELKNKAQ